MHPQALFARLHDEGPEPQRFCLLFAAERAPRGLIVHAAPFAEELNKTRRMVSQQARRLANEGFDVLLPDLLGCGDSPGQFEDATWEDWQTDLVAAAAWLRRQRAGRALPLWLWGTRLGALLAAECAGRCRADGLLLWQPVVDGARHLHQFLRIADANTHLLPKAHAAGGSAGRQLEQGQAINVAGYRITPSLAQGLKAARMPEPNCPVIWVQQRVNHGPVAAQSPPEPAVSSAPDGARVRVLDATGPAFWHQVEAEDASDWWDVTTRAMSKSVA